MRVTWSIGAALALLLLGTTAPVHAAPTRTCHGATATVVGTPGDDRLVGTDRADVVVGLGGNDRILGLGGDDVLCGGPGADELLGGGGDDRLYGGRDELRERERRTLVFGDRLLGGPGDDLLDTGRHVVDGRAAVRQSDVISFRGSAHLVVVDLAEGRARGEGTDVLRPDPDLEVHGSRHDDELFGSRRDEVLDGGRGDDNLFGRGGDDVLLAYRGDDDLSGGRGEDLVIGTMGAGTLSGGGGTDFMVAASKGPTTVLGGSAFDYISRTITQGETGVIDGGRGGAQLEVNPQLWFGEDPAVHVDAPNGTVTSTAGEKSQVTTFSNIASFTLWGTGRTPFTFLGTAAEDFVQVLEGSLDARGAEGDDYFLGYDLDDTLDGGAGTDTAWGYGGTNTCIDTEEGDCQGSPARAGRAAFGPTALGVVRLDRLAARWSDGRRPRN